MPGTPIEELFRSFKSPPGWGGHYLEPDLTAYGVLKDEAAALFVEYDGYYRHAEKEGIARDQKKNAALMTFAPSGSHVIRINHDDKHQLEDNILWVSASTWRRGDHTSLATVLIDVIKDVVFGLEHVLDLRIVEYLLGQMEKEPFLISKSAWDFRDTAMIGSSNTANEVWDFLSAKNFEQADIALMQATALTGGVSIQRTLQPKLQWLLDLGLTRKQAAKAMATFPQILGCSIEQNLRPTLQWLLDLGLTKSQIAKVVATSPPILGYSIKQNLKPTLQWFLDLGLTKSQFAKAVAAYPQFLGCSIEQNLKPTVQWFLDFGLTKSQIAKAVATHPQILGLSIEKNLKPTLQWFLNLGLTKSEVAKEWPLFLKFLA